MKNRELEVAVESLANYASMKQSTIDVIEDVEILFSSIRAEVEQFTNSIRQAGRKGNRDKVNELRKEQRQLEKLATKLSRTFPDAALYTNYRNGTLNQSKKSLENVIRNYQSIYAKLVITNGSTFKELPVLIKEEQQELTVTLEENHKKILSIQPSDNLFISKREILFFNSTGHPYYLIFNNKIPLNLSTYNVLKDYYFHSATTVYGTIGTKRFKGEKISFLLGNQDIYIFHNFYEVFSFKISQLKRMQQIGKEELSCQFKSATNEVSFVSFTKVPKQLQDLLQDTVEKLDMVMVNEEPYLFSLEKQGLHFYQSTNYRKLIQYSDIQSIVILDNRQENMKIHLKSYTNQDVEIYLDHSNVEKTLQTVFQKKKIPLLRKAKLTNLYSSWSKQVNDSLLYNFFGQLVFMQMGMKEIQENAKIGQDMKNRQILNYMYYTIREHKRQVDRVATQFPQMLWKEEGKLLPNQDEIIYEQLQTKLVTLSAQMQRHFTEIENALLPLSFAIIPKKKIDQTNNNSTSNYVAAGAIAGLGLLTGGIAPIAIGAITAMSTYNSDKNQQALQQNRDENENLKINFYIHKALDSFDHLMDTMLPYYVNQFSNTYYSAAKKQARNLQTLQEDSIAKSKVAIFERLTDFYVMKQLPVEDGYAINKEKIIRSIYATPTLNEENLLETY
ncbi:hypothetical protein [Oceanobacillus halophilus]|uniref:Uncharacterized protein n=1 Tax=Oceanobacillus halophilus TaxID=930130 RepID=A0A494ZS49_9BACI|nr:hypothetical protein [Oceanobacillus halophilus]RKQ28679.1 hypothetical protein D8M06_18585 [Oceanobacillus halophilus]